MRKFLVALTVAVVGGGLLAVVPAPVVSSEPASRVATLPAAAGGRATPWPLSHVGVRWTGSEQAVVELRWETAAGWQPWQPVTVSHDMTETAPAGAVFSTLLRAPDATRVDARVVSGDARDLSIVAIDTTHTTHAVVQGRTATAAAATNPGAKVAEPPVVSRAQWGADESWRKGTPEFAPISKLIVHHTDTPNDDPDPAATVRAIYAYHTQGNGWNDIGYNFLVDEQGRVYEGRYARDYGGQKPTGEDADGNGVVGAHALNANRGSVGIALLGTFDGRRPTDAALNAVEDLMAWEADRHSIDPSGSTPYTMGDGSTKTFGNISGHRDTYATACPGDQAYALLPSMRQAVDARVAAAHGTTPGYWTATRTGEVFPFGRSESYGSMAGQRLNGPIVGMAATPSGHGYWLLGTDGGIFSFGDAIFHGSTGGMKLNQPVVGMAATPTGLGYWLVATDGGVFAFGDATFHGSTGSIRLNQPIMAMAASRSPGGGYWLAAKDGGVFAFDVPYRGSVPGLKLRSYAGSVAMRATGTGNGYYILGADGGIFNFGDANFLGARAGVSAAAMDLDRGPNV